GRSAGGTIRAPTFAAPPRHRRSHHEYARWVPRVPPAFLPSARAAGTEAVVILGALLLALQVIQSPRIQSGAIVRPDTVTVGDPFEVIVRVRAPRGVSIEFPQTPDSAGGAWVQAIDPVQVTPSTDTSFTENTAVYRVAAWNVGALPVAFQDVLVK